MMRKSLRLLCFVPLVALGIAAGNHSPSYHFYIALRKNDLKAIQELAKDKPIDEKGNTPLMLAALSGSVEAVDALLKAGADPNEANKNGTTPLMWCPGDVRKVRLLLEHGAKAGTKTKDLHTALELASGIPSGFEAVKLLVEKGADVNALNRGKVSPLENAAGSNCLNIAAYLIAHGAEVNNVDIGGQTALIAAAGNGYDNEAIVRLLIKHGAKVGARSNESGPRVQNGPILIGGLTALHLAAVGNFGATKALIDAGADVNVLDCRKATPLVFAVATDHANPKIVKLLLDRGADPKPAVAWAKRYNNPRILAQFSLKATPVEGDLKAGREGSPTPDYVKTCISKSLSVCQPASAAVLGKGGCISCHAQSYTGLAVSMVKSYGVRADSDLESKNREATAGFAASDQEDMALLQDMGGSYHTVAVYLMHLASAGTKPSLATDTMVHYLLSSQHVTGEWPLSGEVRPPFEDGEFTATAQCVLALRSFAIPGRQAEIDNAVSRAVNWLKHAKPTSTEDRSMQILGLSWAGEKVPSGWVKQLASRQRKHGGWGQTDNLTADAYATGEVLLALHEAGVLTSDPVYKRGIQFLTDTQQADGTWHVVTRSFKFQPYFESGFPYGHDQWISQHGTALATMALASTFPEGK